jgi:hypothetical protein
MNPDTQLSVRERFKVIALASAFLLVFVFLGWLAISNVNPKELSSFIIAEVQKGRPGAALSLCLVTVFCTLGLPLFIIVSIVAVIQGFRGQKTTLTGWILRQITPGSSQPSDAQSEDEKLSSAAGWVCRLLFNVFQRGPDKANHSCDRCGKVLPPEVHYQVNVGSVGYFARMLFDSGCRCEACSIWFCGRCSYTPDGRLGGENFREGFFYLLCPQCKQECRTPMVVTDPYDKRE